MDHLQNAGLTLVTVNPLLTGLSGAATTHSYSAFTIALRGVLANIAANSGVATPTLDVNTGVASLPLAASQGCLYVWMVKADATDGIAQSTIKNLDANGNFIWDSPVFPAIPADYVPYAYIVVKNSAAGSAWAIGVQNWNATGISIVTKNIAVLPDRVFLT